MPIYEYRCASCGHELETMQKISEAPLTDCPACQTSALKKRISAVAFRLKGDGWYETDFKSGQKKNVAGGGEDGDKGKPEGDGEKAAAKADKGEQAANGGKAASNGEGNKAKPSDAAPKAASEPSKSAK